MTKINMPKINIISGKTYDYSGHNMLFNSTYPIDDYKATAFDSIVPENIFEMTREQMKPVVKKIMHQMNVFWSSTNGIPTFPEEFGKYTRLAIRPNTVVIIGRGWSFTIYKKHHDKWLTEQKQAVRAVLKSDMTDSEKGACLNEIIGELPTPIS